MASDNRRIEIIASFKDKISSSFKSAWWAMASTAKKIKSQVNSALNWIKAWDVEDTKFKNALKRMRNQTLTTARSIWNTLQTGIAWASVAWAWFAATWVKWFLEIDSTLTNIQNKTWKYWKDFEAIWKAVKNISLTWYWQSIQEVWDRTALLQQMTGKTWAELEKLTKNSLTFTETFKDSTPEEYLGAVMWMTKNLGWTWEDNMALLLKYRQWNADLRQDLLDTANEYSFAFKEAWFSNVWMLDLLNAAAKEWAFNMDFVWDAVKEFWIRLWDWDTNALKFLKNVRVATGDNKTNFQEMFSAWWESASEAFKKIVVWAMSIKDPILRNQTIVWLFWTKAEDMWMKVVELYGKVDNSQKHQIETTKEAIKVQEQAQKTYEDAASTKFTALTREFQQIIADSFLTKESVWSFFDYIKNNKQWIIDWIKWVWWALVSIAKAVNTLTPYITSLIKWIWNFAKEHPNILAVWVWFIALINPIISITRLLITMWPLFQWLWAILLANPIWALIALIAWFTAYVIADWDKIKYSFIWLWDSVKEPVQKFIDNTMFWLQWLWESIKTWAQSVLQYLQPILDIWNTIMGWMSGWLFWWSSIMWSFQNSVQTGNLWYLSKNTWTSVEDIIWRKTPSQWGTGMVQNITVNGLYGWDSWLVELKTKIAWATLNLNNA